MKSSEKNMFSLRILCGICYFKNATEITLAGNAENPEIWEFVFIFAVHFILKNGSFRHFDTQFELARRNMKSLAKNRKCSKFDTPVGIAENAEI